MTASLRDLQLALLEMLKDIDAICKENKITYSLAGGTALGAVRHGGFIPWDDDVDIMLLRSEYEHFLDVAAPYLQKKGYTLQKEFSETWPMTYSKVRKDNTAYIEDYEPRIRVHQGIFIDLFPIDNLSDNKWVASLQWNAFHILAARGLRKRGYTTNSFKKRFAMWIAPLFPVNILRTIVMQKGHNNTRRVHCFFGGAVVRDHNHFPRDLFNEFVEVRFEDAFFSLVKDYDTYLRINYNDYMTLPPEEERTKRMHAKFVDLENSYTIYIKQ